MRRAFFNFANTAFGSTVRSLNPPLAQSASTPSLVEAATQRIVAPSASTSNFESRLFDLNNNNRRTADGPLLQSLNVPHGQPVPPSALYQLPASLRALFEAHGVSVLGSEVPAVNSEAFLRSLIDNHVLPNGVAAPREDAFYVCDLATVIRQYRQWHTRLPNVETFYAVKSLPDPLVVRTLAALGASFDCASQEEIDMVLNCGQGVTPDRIIFAHPCKLTSHLRHARNVGVTMMTFDSEAELHKTARLYPSGAELVLRIATDGASAKCNLSAKFGAPLDMVPGLLDTARELNLNVVGVSFHVGSLCTDPSAFSRAITDAKAVFDMAAVRGFSMNLLDVGGGFPGTQNNLFEEISSNLAGAIDEHFPAGSGVRVIAEPGRYFCSASHTLVTSVQGRKKVHGKNVLFVDDGVYQSFNCIMYDHQKPVPRPLRADPQAQYLAQTSKVPLVNSKIFGPTCDSVDVVADDILLPEDVSPGDWLVYEEMGAYTRASASSFNGFAAQNNVVYVCSDLAN